MVVYLVLLRAGPAWESSLANKFVQVQVDLFTYAKSACCWLEFPLVETDSLLEQDTLGQDYTDCLLGAFQPLHLIFADSTEFSN